MTVARDPLERPGGYAPPATVAELLARYAAGERYFEEWDTEEACFVGVSLAGANLGHSWFHGADFRDADLRGARFDRSNLKCIDFSGADRTGASIRECALCGSVIGPATRCDNVDLTDTTCYGGPVTDLRQLLPHPSQD